MAIPTSLTSKDEFVNTSDGWVGVVQLDHLGQAKGQAVEPGGSTFLSEEEQILTANAPRLDEDNPFANGTLALKTRAVEMVNRRPYGEHAGIALAEADEPEVDTSETGAAPPPAGDPPEGTRLPEEEVATPDAPARMGPKPGARRRKVS